MITKSGVKLLDFGLARLETRPDVTHDSPTVVNPITTDGMILGGRAAARDADRLRYTALLHRNSAVSPNGEWLVYTGTKDGKPSLWLRNLSTDTAAPIPKTEGAGDPFWSPDSKNIRYFSGPKVWRITISGEGPTAICDVAQGATVSATWGTDGTILFADLGTKGGLLRVPASGGTPEPMKLSSLRPDGRPFAPSFVDADRFFYCDVIKGFDLHLHRLRNAEDGDSRDVVRSQRRNPRRDRTDRHTPGEILARRPAHRNDGGRFGVRDRRSLDRGRCTRIGRAAHQHAGE